MSKTKSLLVFLGLTIATFGIAQVASLFLAGKTSVVRWDAPTLNEDGTELTDLAGYEVAIYVSGVDPTTNPDPLFVQDTASVSTSISVLDLLSDSSLSPGQYNLAVRAYDEHGNRSVFSDHITVDIDIVSPGSPNNVRSEK